MKKVILGIVVIVLVCVIGGAVYRQQGVTQASTAVMRTVTDSTGTTVQIPIHPKRVVFLNVSNMDLYVTAGGTAAIAGKPTSHAMSPELQKAVAQVPEVGIIHSPNVEKIISLKPDLVVGINVPFHNQIRKTLQDNGIPLYINSLDNYEDTIKTLQFFGSLTGDEKGTQEKIKAIDAKCHAVETLKNGRASPKTLIIFSSPASNNMATANSFSGDVLRRMGGTNIADFDASLSAPYVPLSMEYVVKQNPDIIFIISMGTSAQMNDEFRHQMQVASSWRQVKAVRDHRIYELPMDLFTVNPGSRIGDAMLYMAHCLYGRGEAS